MLLYDRIKASLIKRNMTSSILVYFVAFVFFSLSYLSTVVELMVRIEAHSDRLQSVSLPREKWEAFLSGFGKTKNPCFVIDPLDSSSSLRITR